ncbi:toprim domain-containing protein [Marinibactrum halimedae]|uniref:Toprim domain-containing protein n=1 Tax=Marinibactrum halimedae TaxID=1444977 RepID=A0AA37T6W7_9GAMM|nr:toprim domain-containing protein [Marinibactrum halimedae]MCD9459161.1 toprim domain-containing protein [Marinibactrum halimedae]GLS24761.1 hypothetical protein GCM10007877_04750 [Marinibactrum halimedae]
MPDYLNIDDEIIESLRNDTEYAFKERSNFFQYGRCPNCGKKELFVGKDKPGLILCNRRDECGFSITTRERYPALWENFAERFPSTDHDPNATARAFLGVNRGFNTDKLEGWYTQGFFQLPDNNWAQTCRFRLFEGEDYWERIIDPAHVKRAGKKARFKQGTKYTDKHWSPPGQVIKKNDRVYITEGIFHTIAYHHIGKKAVCAFSCNNLPREFIAQHKDDNIIWCLAYDDEPGAHKHIRKYYQELKTLKQTVEIALTGSKKDWDDLYRLDRLNDEELEACKWRGQLFIAESAKQKAFMHYAWKQQSYCILPFENQLYSVRVNLEVLSKQLDGERFDHHFHRDEFFRAAKIKNISNCIPNFLYVQKDKFTDERRYFFDVKLASSNRRYHVGITGPALTEPRAFGQALISNTDGGTFDGAAGDLKKLRDQWLNRQVDFVETVPFVGYDEESQTYIFPECGYQNGQRYELNEQGYIQLPNRGIKTTLSSIKITSTTEFDPTWVRDFIKVFHLNGVCALAYWTMSLFSQQIKLQLQGMPFLEITGEKESGKTTLIRFLWKLFGRSYEGVDMNEMTDASRGRTFGQISNLPMVLLESDREVNSSAGGRPTTAVNWDVMKKLTDLNAVISSRGIKTNDNNTNEILNRAAYVVAQNASVDGGEPILSRFFHLHFTTAHKRPENRPIADRLKAMAVEDLGGYLHHVLTHEKEYLDQFFTYFKVFRERLDQVEELKVSDRTVDFHAQAMASVELLKFLLPEFPDFVIEKALDHVVERAKNRIDRMSCDHPEIARAWDFYLFQNYRTRKITIRENGKEETKTEKYEILNQHKQKNLIAINLNDFVQQARKAYQEPFSIDELKRLLPNSKRPKYLAKKKIRSSREGGNSTPMCFIFEKPSDWE